MLVLKQSFPDGFSLHKARRFNEEEKPHYAEWFREQGFISLETTPLPHISWDDVSHRDPDGSFLGDSNRAWIVSDEEAQNYLSPNGQRAIAKEQKDAITEAASHAAELEKQYEATKAQFVSWTCTPIHEKNGEKECTHTFAFPDETLLSNVMFSMLAEWLTLLVFPQFRTTIIGKHSRQTEDGVFFVP